jgi:hypothetical protein
MRQVASSVERGRDHPDGAVYGVSSIIKLSEK